MSSSFVLPFSVVPEPIVRSPATFKSSGEELSSIVFVPEPDSTRFPYAANEVFSMV